jgi:hypothetical protein
MIPQWLHFLMSAFVKEFGDNSDIAVEKTVCLPK